MPEPRPLSQERKKERIIERQRVFFIRRHRHNNIIKYESSAFWGEDLKEGDRTGAAEGGHGPHTSPSFFLS